MRSLLENVIRGAELLAARGHSLPLSDAELLQRLTQERDQSVFVLLVRRHASLVWGVCRQMLPNDQDAEDAFQATFLVLVRSLDTVRKQQSLGSWLHGVAYRIALKIRREAARRKQREERVRREERSLPVADSTWNRLQGIVHEEIASLPEHLREAFVLCCLEGRSQHEAAEQLGWKLGTLSARVTQARQRLLDRLTRRDIALSTAAAMLAGNMSSGGPALAVTQSAASLVSARLEAIPTTINALAQGVVPMMWTRTKLAVLGIVFGGLVTTGVGWLATSEAQTPAIHAEIENLLTALREEKTEYRFVQIVKPLTIDEMKKVLALSEREGWSYCGSQEMVTKEGKPQPHMVFKRAKTSVVEEQAIQKALGEKVRAEVQERLQQAERERADAAQAAHEQLRERNLHDSIETAKKRIAETKALLDVASAAGKKEEAQRLASELKKFEEILAALQGTLALEAEARSMRQWHDRWHSPLQDTLDQEAEAPHNRQITPAEVEQGMKTLREAEAKIEKLRAMKDSLFARGITAENKKIDQEIAAHESVIKLLRSYIDKAKKKAVDASLPKSSINETEARIARMKTELEKLNSELKPQRIDSIKQRQDLELSLQAEELKMELLRRKQMESEKRDQLFKKKIQDLEAQSAKLSAIRLASQKELNSLEEEINGLRQKQSVASLNNNNVEAEKLVTRIKELSLAKEEIGSRQETLTRQSKELAQAREAFLREATQNEIESIRNSTERPPVQETIKDAVLKTYTFPPTMPWKHAAGFMKVFESEKGNVVIKKDGEEYSLIVNASAAAHEKAAEYIKKNNVPISTKK